MDLYCTYTQWKVNLTFNPIDCCKMRGRRCCYMRLKRNMCKDMILLVISKPLQKMMSIVLHNFTQIWTTIVYLLSHSTTSQTVHHKHQAGLLLFQHCGHEYLKLCHTHYKWYIFYVSFNSKSNVIPIKKYSY